MDVEAASVSSISSAESRRSMRSYASRTSNASNISGINGKCHVSKHDHSDTIQKTIFEEDVEEEDNIEVEIMEDYRDTEYNKAGKGSTERRNSDQDDDSQCVIVVVDEEEKEHVPEVEKSKEASNTDQNDRNSIVTYNDTSSSGDDSDEEVPGKVPRRNVDKNESCDGENSEVNLTDMLRKQHCARKHCWWITIFIALLSVVIVVRVLIAIILQAQRYQSVKTQTKQQHLSTNIYNEEPIVNGFDARTGRYPYYTGIWSYSSQYCGGMLIDKEWVLTAAHCLVYIGDTAIVGQYLNAYPNGGQNSDVRTIDEVYQHPFYSPFRWGFDAALLHLSEPSTIEPVKVNGYKKNKRVDIKRDDRVDVIGFGRLEFFGALPDILQTVAVNFVPFDDCDDIFSNDPSSPLYPADSDICAVAPSQGACHGDSGGPLFVPGDKEDGSKDVLIGIVSRGEPCATGLPDIYTAVAHEDVLDWIEETVKKSSKKKKNSDKKGKNRKLKSRQNNRVRGH